MKTATNGHSWIKASKNSLYDFFCSECGCKRMDLIAINGARIAPAYSTSETIGSAQPICQ